MTAITLVIVNYMSAKLVEASLERIGKASGIGIVVVDNFSTDLELSRLVKLQSLHPFTLLPVTSNVGFGAGVNIGVASAIASGSRIIGVINPDLAITGDSVRHLAAAAVDDDRAFVSPSIYDGTGNLWFGGASVVRSVGVARHDAPPAQVTQWLSGACLFGTAHAWRHSGGFDEDYFLYWEDVDFSFRWSQTGGHLVVDREASAVHYIGGSQVGESKSHLYTYYMNRNRALFARKHLRLFERGWWMLMTPIAGALMLRYSRLPRRDLSGHVLRAALGSLTGWTMRSSRSSTLNSSLASRFFAETRDAHD